MPDSPCCICGQPSTKTIRHRAFCEKHYATATRERPLAWRSLAAQIGGLVVFVAVIYGLQWIIQPIFTPTTLFFTGVALSLVPAFIWLSFFYQQDRVEPEPKGYVLGVFVLGGLLAAAVGAPLVNQVFRLSEWIYADPLTAILGNILIVGFTQEFLKYAAVRYTVYGLPEFDEATDGIIYATAAGLGYATVLNIQFIIASQGVDIGAGVFRIVVTALAQASFAGVVGYFLGRAKFEDEPVWWMPLGLSLAALGSGVFNWLRGQVTQGGGVTVSGSVATPWIALVLAVVVAVGITALVTWLIRRSIQLTLAEA